MGQKKSKHINIKTIPNMTVGPDSSFVNFITRAESVALAPIVDFGTSLGVFSVFGFEDFNLFVVAELFGLPEPCSCSWINNVKFRTSKFITYQSYKHWKQKTKHITINKCYLNRFVCEVTRSNIIVRETPFIIWTAFLKA